MTITVPRWLASPLLVLALLLMGFLTMADTCGGSNTAEQGQVGTQQDLYNRHQPIRTYQYSAERGALLRTLTLEVDAEEQRNSMRLPQRRDPERYVRMRAH